MNVSELLSFEGNSLRSLYYLIKLVMIDVTVVRKISIEITILASGNHNFDADQPTEIR
jgi:hypothetical protein